MMKLLRFLPVLLLGGLVGLTVDRAADAPVVREQTGPLIWDALDKMVEAKLGDRAAEFSFKVTNTADREITIFQVRPSCGCTVVDLPATPWVLAPGAGGTVRATVDFTGKEGDLIKTLLVTASSGTQLLRMHIVVPRMDEKMRAANQKLALANRQAVFQGDCASCHATPAAGKKGEDLFREVCLVCHAPDQRASMVPDLLVAREHRDEAFWRKWISEGRESTLMPAFARKNGGPLTDEQIESLVEFAVQNLPTEPRRN
jgi:mono/diheme cytochrome c family protein